jgi:hypothetical protein
MQRLWRDVKYELAWPQFPTLDGQQDYVARSKLALDRPTSSGPCIHNVHSEAIVLGWKPTPANEEVVRRSLLGQ